jgi:hypothetical protein
MIQTALRPIGGVDAAVARHEVPPALGQPLGSTRATIGVTAAPSGCIRRFHRIAAGRRRNDG